LILSGTVRDSSTHSPLPGAVVRIQNTVYGTVADHHGHFHLHEAEGDSVDVDVHYVGYQRKRMRIAVKEDVVIDLVPMMIESGRIVVQEQGNMSGGGPTQRVESLSEQQINEIRGQTITSALQSVPGVTVMTSGPSVARAVVHGVYGQRIVVSNAGVAQEGQQWGSDHGTEIDALVPVRMAVVKGPSSLMYGPNAMGGAISIEPSPFPSLRSPETAGVSGRAIVNLFSNNLQGAVGGFVQSVRPLDAPVAVRAYAGVRRAGDARTPDYVLDNTAYEQWTVGTNMKFELDTSSNPIAFTVDASLFNADLGIFSGAHLGNATDMRRAIERGRPADDGEFSYTIDPPHSTVQHMLLSASAKLPFNDHNAILAHYGLQQNARSEFDTHSLSHEALSLKLVTYSGDVQFEHALSENSHGHLGVSGMFQVNDRTGSVDIIPDYELLGGGVFAFESVELDNVLLSAGARYDSRQLTTRTQQNMYASISGAAGARIQISPVVSTALNISTAWRPPQANELYSNDVHHGVAQYEIGDSTLGPERTIGGDVSFDLNDGSVDLSVTGYVNMFDSYITSLPDPDNPTVTIRGTFPTFRYTQFDAVISGIDVSFEYNFTDIASLYAKGSIVRGTDTEHDQPLFLMPADRLRIGGHIHAHDVWGMHHVFADISVLGVRTQDRFVEAMDYAPPPPGYVLTDLMLGAELDVFGTPCDVSMSVLNVFGVAYRDYLSRYRYFADDPGRDVVVRFTIPFGKQ